MQPCRKLAAALAAAALLAAGPQAAHADITPFAGLGLTGLGTPVGDVGATGCGPAHGAEFIGGTAGSNSNACGSVLVFIGPSSTVNTTIGPTIISPGFAGVVVTANGPVAGP
jgi:hypothetical protein